MNIKPSRQCISSDSIEEAIIPDLNGLKYIDAPASLVEKISKETKLFRLSEDNLGFTPPLNMSLSSLMTKPENQNPYGTCVAWSSTTFIESMLWKLTGSKEEFTTDEVYNIYLDAWQYNPNTLSVEEINAKTRKGMRSDSGTWTLNSRYNTGLYHYLNNFQLYFDYAPSSQNKDMQIYTYYWMAHYNDPEVRKNHYPDKFSPLCEKFKNYVWNNIYTYGSGESSTAGNIINPNTFKMNIQSFGNPTYASLNGTSGGHGVVLYKYSPSTVSFDSSWNSSKIYDITFGYSNTSPYYNSTTYAGLSRLNGLDVFKDSQSSQKKYSVEIIGDNKRYVYGIENNDMFPSSRNLTLLANHQINSSKFFSAWSISSMVSGITQKITYAYRNPVSFKLSNDILIEPIYDTSAGYSLSSRYALDVAMPSNCSASLTSSCSLNDINSNSLFQDVYEANENIIALAKPISGYVFDCWNDGISSNPRSIVMSSDQFLSPIVKIYPSKQIPLSSLDLMFDVYCTYYETLSTSGKAYPIMDGIKNRSTGKYLSANQDYIVRSMNIYGDDVTKECSQISIVTVIEGTGLYTGIVNNITTSKLNRGLYMIVNMSLDKMVGLSNLNSYGQVTYSGATTTWRGSNPSKGNDDRICQSNGSYALFWQPSTCEISPKTITYTPISGYQFEGWYCGDAITEKTYPKLSNSILYSLSSTMIYDSTFPIYEGYGFIYGKIKKI